MRQVLMLKMTMPEDREVWERKSESQEAEGNAITKGVNILYAFFWVIPRRLNFICRRFGTLFHLHRPVGMKYVPKRRHIKFRRRGITQKKAYNIQKKAKA